MLKRGATVSKYDSALFLWHKDGKLVGILAAYVDDFAYCGTYQWERIVADSFKSAFKISSSAIGAFQICRVECASVEERDKGGSEFLHCEDPANIFRK